MKLFSSWSGGKDCMLALHRIQKSGEHEVKVLLNMCDSDSDFSRSHGIHSSMIVRQAEALEIEPNNPRYLDLAITLAIEVKNKNYALTLLERLREVNPENAKLVELFEEISKLPETENLV